MTNPFDRPVAGGVLPRSRRLCLLAASALLAGPALAMDYSVHTEVETEGQYDNNIQMLSEDPTSATGLRVSPSLSLRAKSETTEVSLDGIMWFRRYNRANFDSNDQQVSTSITQHFDRSDLTLSAQGTRDTTLTSEYLDSGRVTDAGRHKQYSLAPAWTGYIGERDLITLRGSYSQSKYDSDNYTDYTYWQGSARWTRVMSERLRLFLEANYSKYQTAKNNLTIQESYTTSADTGFQVGGSYAFTEQFSITALVGSSRDQTRSHLKYSQAECDEKLTQFHNDAVASGNPADLFWANNFGHAICQMPEQEFNSRMSTLDASLNWSNELHQLSLEATQQSQPSSNGYTIRSSQLNGTWAYQLWEQGSLSLDVTVGRNRAMGNNSDSIQAIQVNREFSYTALAYRQNLSENWSVNLSYQYRHQNYDKVDFEADSKAVYLGLSYKPRDRHWSR